MGDLSKRLFAKNVFSRCDRQLFLTLAEGKDWWIDPLREIVVDKDHHAMKDHHLEKVGHDYEQQVYAWLQASFTTRANVKDGKVAQTFTSPDGLRACKSAMEKQDIKMLLLLEHEFGMPASFVQHLFPPHPGKAHGKIPPGSPVECSSLRPDIIRCEKLVGGSSSGVVELLPGGAKRVVPMDELERRIALSIVDVKSTIEENVGNKHFIEIVYYAWALSFFLHEHGLDRDFLVRTSGNGIFPKRENLSSFLPVMDAAGKTPVVPMGWEDHARVFASVVSRIHRLWAAAPCSVESVSLNLQPECGYCEYLLDCTRSLGMRDGVPPDEWSLRLIPYTSPSVAQQLLDRGFKTVGDVHERVRSIPRKGTPEPIHPELPLLEVKARALVEGKRTMPPVGTIHPFSLPRFSAMSISFAGELDKSCDRVFALGIMLHMSVGPKVEYFRVFEAWWQVWKPVLTGSEASDEIIKERLDRELHHEISLENVRLFRESISRLEGLTVLLPGDLLKDKPVDRTEVVCTFTRVNKQYADEQSEVDLAKAFIEHMFHAIRACTIIEDHVGVPSKFEGKFLAPDTALFYWSREQLGNIERMLERCLGAITSDPASAGTFARFLAWIAPEESEVRHAYQHKKLYDLQAFVESVEGFPLIINYTWRDLANVALDFTLHNPVFWIDHFNYMNALGWHLILNAKDAPTKEKHEEKLKKHLKIKLSVIHRLRLDFQIKAKDILSRRARPMRSIEYEAEGSHGFLNPVAQAWYMFSRLSGSMALLDAENALATYPEFSIGKMIAAEVSDLDVIPLDNDLFVHSFSLLDLSSNMKVREGDRVMLVPNDLRGIGLGPASRPWIVSLDEMSWDPAINGYRVVTAPSRGNLLARCEEELQAPAAAMTWFLYPTTIDAWSGKLVNGRGNGLLQDKNLGTSWLGKRLAYWWELGSCRTLEWPSDWSFSAPEVYMYHPAVLRSLRPAMPPATVLRTRVHPLPDPSQARAIELVMGSVMSGIRGPPGTGKSQSIAALVDEYLARHGGPARVLITAFSYAAIRVLIDKIRKSVDASGAPAPVARVQMVFLRSEYQDPVSDVPGCRHVNDLVRTSSSWRLDGKGRTVTKAKTLERYLEPRAIIFANPHQLYHLRERVEDGFAFDLAIIDEASQMPADQALPCMHFIKHATFTLAAPAGAIEGAPVPSIDAVSCLPLAIPPRVDRLTRVVIVGDHNQLPPVLPVEPPAVLKPVLSSAFHYLVERHGIPVAQLAVNYRSHADIVVFTNMMGFYENLVPAPSVATRALPGDPGRVQEPWVASVLDPATVVSTLVHQRRFESAVSPLEAEIVARLACGYFDMVAPAGAAAERRFWEEGLGVVSPHNAHGRLIIHRIYELMTGGGSHRTHLDGQVLMSLLKRTVYSVEKFQGSDRDLIIASMGISDPDQLLAEEEFIYDSNRFNVLTSRAKSKVVLVCSEQFLDHLPDKKEAIQSVGQVRKFALAYCNTSGILLARNEFDGLEPVTWRWKGDGSVQVPDGFHFGGGHDDGTFHVSFTPVPVLAEALARIPAGTWKHVDVVSDIEHRVTFNVVDIHDVKQLFPVPHRAFIGSMARTQVTGVAPGGDRAAMAPVPPAPAAPGHVDLPDPDEPDRDLY